MKCAIPLRIETLQGLTQVDAARLRGEDRAVRRWVALLTWASLLAALAVACSKSGSGGNERHVQASDYGPAWPLTVSSGVLRCEVPALVTFTTEDETTYAVNGAAGGFAEDRGWVDDISPIWKEDPRSRLDPALTGLKVNIGPLIDDGLALCEGP
jgi:hypothetical protein